MKQRKTDQQIFGENLRLLRRIYGLTQRQLAQIMGVSLYCYRQAERGIFANSLDAEAIVNVSRHFRLPPSAFLTAGLACKQQLLKELNSFLAK